MPTGGARLAPERPRLRTGCPAVLSAERAEALLGKPVVLSLKWIDATEVMVRLAKNPHPRDLQEQIYSDSAVKSWPTPPPPVSEFPPPKRDHTKGVEAWEEIALGPVNKMAASGKFEMRGKRVEDRYGVNVLGKRAGELKEGAPEYRQIDSDLFQPGRRQHYINDCGHVLTGGNGVYSDVQFLREEIEAYEAYLAAEDGAAVAASAPQADTTLEVPVLREEVDAYLAAEGGAAVVEAAPQQAVGPSSRASPEHIRKTIEDVYKHAKEKGMKPPNVKQIVKPVQDILSHHQYHASGQQIQEIAQEEVFKESRRKPGHRVNNSLLPFSLEG
jgi:hypothetical protein